MCSRLRKKGQRIRESLERGKWRHIMSAWSRRIMLNCLLSNRSKRYMVHHMLVQMQQKQRWEYNGQNSENFRVRPAQSQGSVEQGGKWAHACAMFGRIHPGKCRNVSKGCFKCGQEGHFMKECPKNMQGNENQGNKAQSSSFALLNHRDWHPHLEASEKITTTIQQKTVNLN